jgi:large subunit ribosomal protein L30
MSLLRVTQVRSTIGLKPKQRGTLRALGLRKPHDTVELPDRPEIRGMVASVPHLVQVETGDAEPAETTTEAPPASADLPTDAGGAEAKRRRPGETAKRAPAKKAPSKKKAVAKKAPAKKTAKKAT